MFVDQHYNIWFCITEIRQLIFRCNIWCNIQISINHWQRFRLCRVTQQFRNNYDGNPKKYIIIHIGKHQARCFFTAVWRRNTSDQDAPNKHLPIHGVGSESLCIKIKIEIFLYRDRKVFYSSTVANCVFRHTIKYGIMIGILIYNTRRLNIIAPRVDIPIGIKAP